MNKKENLLDFVEWAIDDNVDIEVEFCFCFTNEKQNKIFVNKIPKMYLRGFKDHINSTYNDDLSFIDFLQTFKIVIKMWRIAE